MMSPGYTAHPDHRITTEPMSGRVEVFMDGEKIAESRRAIKLHEPNYPERIYIPREDIREVEFTKYKDYHCPFKGQAELYNVKHGSHIFENAAWSYVRPYDDVKEIKNMVAFYSNKVQLTRVTG